MSKITKLVPILIEETCEYCGDGILKLVKETDDGVHIFKKVKPVYEYRCEKCGRVVKSDKRLRLKKIGFINPETKEGYSILSM